MFIDAKQIDFSYRLDLPVLRQVSFNVERNHTLAIVGASGCGKSTLLRLIAGILPQRKAETLIGQITVGGLSPDEYRKLGKLAFMFQEPTLMPNLTVKENIAFPLKIKGIENDSRVEELISAVGLQAFKGYYPVQLSGGMKTRVALARSFVTNPELLLLDEPFAALDISWKSRLYKELERLLEMHKTTVVFVTHDVQESLLLSNNVLVFSSKGSVKAEFQIKTEKTISSRVSNISDFMSEVFVDYMMPIQDAIMNGAVEDLGLDDSVTTADGRKSQGGALR